MIKLYAMLIVIALLGGAGYGAYAYYKDSQARIATLTTNNAKLDGAIKTSEAAIASIQKDMKKVNIQLKKVSSNFADIRNQNSKLAQKLETIDLGILAFNKPKSIERAINGGTKNAGRCFEILSGSPFTVREKEAKDAKSFNKECPWLWPGNTSTQ
jgi:cytochrome c551/c552